MFHSSMMWNSPNIYEKIVILSKGSINIPFLFNLNKKHIEKTLFCNKKGKNESLIAPLILSKWCNIYLNYLIIFLKILEWFYDYWR
jgi:hypothetical protein